MESSVREAAIQVGDREIKLAVVHGLANAQKLLKEIDEGRAYYHLIEVMTCQGGCVGGAGQPHALLTRKQRRPDGPLQACRAQPVGAEYSGEAGPGGAP